MSQNLSSAAVVFVKDKDKEALFNIAYNVTDNISSRAILRHNKYIFNRYLPALLYLPSTTPFMQASARELLVRIKFHNQTYVVGTQKYCINETVLLSTPQKIHVLNLWLT